jgi:hypothetical protein
MVAMVEWDAGGVGEYALVEHPNLAGDLHAGAGELLLYMCPILLLYVSSYCCSMLHM